MVFVIFFGIGRNIWPGLRALSSSVSEPVVDLPGLYIVILYIVFSVNKSLIIMKMWYLELLSQRDKMCEIFHEYKTEN